MIMRSVCLLAGGWVLLALALPPSVLTIVLGTYVLADIGSRMLADFADAGQDGISGTRSPQDRYGRILAGWLIVTVALLVLFTTGKLLLYRDQPAAVLALLGLLLTLAVSRVQSGAVVLDNLLAARVLFAAGAIEMTKRLGDPGAELFLVSLALSQLGLCLALWILSAWWSRAGPAHPAPSGRSEALDHVDLLCLPLVLSGPEALIYLAARGLTLVVPMGLDHLGHVATPAVRAAYGRGKTPQFFALAARLNLGFLLIGGSMCLGVMITAPYVPSVIGLPAEEFDAVLIWLLAGVSAPVVFGATDALLTLTGKQGTRAACTALAALLFVAAVMSASGPTALILAKSFAAFLLIKAMVASGILAWRTGVWPGLTALLLKRIRLL